jgi:hypothetical protein
MKVEMIKKNEKNSFNEELYYIIIEPKNERSVFVATQDEVEVLIKKLTLLLDEKK